MRKLKDTVWVLPGVVCSQEVGGEQTRSPGPRGPAPTPTLHHLCSEELLFPFLKTNWDELTQYKINPFSINTNQGNLLHSPCCPTTASNSRVFFIIQRGNPVPTGSHSPIPRPQAPGHRSAFCLRICLLWHFVWWNHLTCDLASNFHTAWCAQSSPTFQLVSVFFLFVPVKFRCVGGLFCLCPSYPPMNTMAVSAFQLLWTVRLLFYFILLIFISLVCQKSQLWPMGSRSSSGSWSHSGPHCAGSADLATDHQGSPEAA